MNIVQKVVFLFIATAFTHNYTVVTEPVNDVYTTNGRVEKIADNEIILISAASSVTFGFSGTKCTVNLKAEGHRGYVAIEVDGVYYGREVVVPSGTSIPVTVSAQAKHTVTIYKATEATTGNITFTGAEGNLFKVAEKPKKKIEFIGDSITSGMGNDIKEMPCGTGEWYDQHNAYYSYAPITARSLGADFLLSSVSGIGMYRHWNDEHEKEPTMPDVYENLYLIKDISKPYSFGFNPDITCIALGTNDFSDGDGKKTRLPFNEDKYVANYTNFIQTIYKHAPNTRVVLLNSPMVTGPKAEVFIKCLKKVKDAVNAKKGHKPVTTFSFTAVTPHGCTYHPEIEDDKLMAAQLAPYLKTLLNEN